MSALDCDRRPCSSCPYVRSTPAGVWHVDEYAKLPTYDDSAAEPALGVFLCHQSNAHGRSTVCRGWLSVHADSIAVRLALLNGSITVKQRDAAVDVELYDTGADAAAAGAAGIENPSPAARRLIDRLIDKGAART